MAGLSPVAALFDALAATYDQSGVDFFQPVGRRLVELLGPRPGDRALDVGCGRGAVTVPLAEAVGASGSVRAVDAAPAMVEATRAEVAARGLDRVEVGVADAADIGSGPYDVVASSLVLFFVPEPEAALAGWVRALGSGGRLGLTSFGRLDEATRGLDDLLLAYAPPGLRDARTSGTEGPFATAAATEEMARRAGLREVETVVDEVLLDFPDAAAWERFSRATGQRAMWNAVPDAELATLRGRAAELLGRGPLTWEIRYTLGVR